MKKLKYVIAFAIALTAMSCTEENVTPQQRGEDDPIGVPPPPPPIPPRP